MFVGGVGVEEVMRIYFNYSFDLVYLFFGLVVSEEFLKFVKLIIIFFIPLLIIN